MPATMNETVRPEASSMCVTPLTTPSANDSVGSISRLRFSAARVRKIAQTSSGVE